MTDALKQAGVQTANKVTLSAVNKIPGKALTAINQKLVIVSSRKLEQKEQLI